MLSVRQNRPVVAGLFASIATAGAVAPKPVASAHARLEAATAALRERPHPNGNALPAAVLAALEAGKDPTTHPEVTRILMAQVLASRHGLDDEVSAILIEDIRAVVRTHADGIVGAWGVPFNKAAADLTAALEVLGPIDLDDTHAVVTKGPAATTAWTAAVAAVAAVDNIATGWGFLHQLVTGGWLTKSHRIHVITNITANDWHDRTLDGTDANPWHATLNGLTLRLSTIDEVRADLGGIEQAGAARVARAEQEARDARRPDLRPAARRAVVS